MSQQQQASPSSPNDGDMGSLDRLDSLDDYFMISSPPESPQQPNRQSLAKTGSAGVPAAPLDVMGGYYVGSGANSIAVHQDNLKLSTSNMAVDRSNAVNRRDSFGGSYGGRLGRGINVPMLPRSSSGDELMKLVDGTDSNNNSNNIASGINLSELFLQSNHRTSLNENYQAMGKLKGHDKDLHRTRSHSLSSSFLSDNNNNGDSTNNGDGDNSNDNTNKSATNIDNSTEAMDLDLDSVMPTPLSEIKAKSEIRELRRKQLAEQRQQRRRQAQQQELSSNNSNLTSQTLDQHQYEQNRRSDRHQHSSNYYPFGRAYQLPIPTITPLSPTNNIRVSTQANNDTAENNSGNDVNNGTKKGVSPLFNAVATAAALASVQDQTDATNNTATNATATDSSHLPSTNAVSNNVNQQQHTPPHSPPVNKTTSPWQQHPTSASSSTHSSSRYPPHPLPPHGQPPPPHPSHYQQHPQSSYSPSHHHLAPPLAVGNYSKIVGPYTTAQQTTNISASAVVPPANAKSSSTNPNNANTTVKSTLATAPAPPTSYLPRRGDHLPPREASVAHTRPKKYLEDAARQRSGYSGFHKPATSQTTNNYHHPLPSKFPDYASSATTTNSRSTAAGPPSTIYAPNKATTTTASSSGALTNMVPPTTGSATTAPAAAYLTASASSAAATAALATNLPPESAYERKKQRAKDARVKLNESIERLHVSMSVAGTESKRRTDQLKEIIKRAGRSTETTTDHQAFQLMESCVKTAESAKKWDRPNFVGSAATMIQCLNSQCEILMKELLEYQNGNKLANAGGVASSKMVTEKQEQKSDQQELTNGKRSPQATPVADNNQADHPDKRRRLDGDFHESDEKIEASSVTQNGGVATSSVSAEEITVVFSLRNPQGNHLNVELEPSVTDIIASFLDPGSLIQCMKVCKSWRTKNVSFAKSKTWVKLCVKRFGFFKVRQWQEKHNEDGRTGSENHVGGLTLYRRMNDANVMPPLQMKCSARQCLLGASRMISDGVAAWMFLVERSNGETMRSVKRNPEETSMSRGAGLYSSLPVVELRIIIQNTGGTSTQLRKKISEIMIKNQQLTIDASTRRRGGEISEINWDDRFEKKILKMDGSKYESSLVKPAVSGELARLELFESVVLVCYMHARGCSTTAKFVQRSNFMKVLASVNGTTLPIVIPFVNQLI